MNHANENKRRELDVLRNRLESVYLETYKWGNAVLSDQLAMMSVMSDKLSYDSYCDLLIESDNEFDFQKIEMYIDIYFSEFKHVFKELLECRNVMHEDATLYIREMKGHKNKDRWDVKRYMHNGLIFEEKVKWFLSKIVAKEL